MFYCPECEARRKWPNGFMKSYGACEICGKTALCSDVPSYALPEGRN